VRRIATILRPDATHAPKLRAIGTESDAGKGVAMKVRDVMSTRSLLTLREEDEVGLAAQMMLWAGVRHLPVLRGREVVGLVSERDLARHFDAAAPVVRAMSSPVAVVSADEDLVEAASLMTARRIGCLPVMEQGTLVGMLSTTDLLAHEVAQVLDAEARPEPTVGAAMTPDPSRSRRGRCSSTPWPSWRRAGSGICRWSTETAAWWGCSAIATPVPRSAIPREPSKRRPSAHASAPCVSRR
jgi:CBS domain-containing protein